MPSSDLISIPLQDSEYHEGAHNQFTKGVELRGEGCVDGGISD